MNETRGTVAALLLTLLVLASPLAADEIEVRLDDSLKLSGFGTYAWDVGTPAHRYEVQTHIVAAVDRELGARGLRQATADADLKVAVHVLVDRHTLEQLEDPLQWEFWTGIRDTDAYDLQAGTLVIDLVDGDTGRGLWRALSSAPVREPVKKMLKKVDKTIHKMFERLP